MNKQQELLEAVEKLMKLQKANHVACNPITWGNLYHGDDKPEWLVLSEMIPQKQLFFFDNREEMPPFKHFKYSDELAEKIQSRKKEEIQLPKINGIIFQGGETCLHKIER